MYVEVENSPASDWALPGLDPGELPSKNLKVNSDSLDYAAMIILKTDYSTDK